jgi:hypothetical protein
LTTMSILSFQETLQQQIERILDEFSRTGNSEELYHYLNTYKGNLIPDSRILHAAIRQENLQSVYRILDAKADPNALNHGNSAVLLAAECMNPSILQAIMEYGGNANTRDCSGTPLLVNLMTHVHKEDFDGYKESVQKFMTVLNAGCNLDIPVCHGHEFSVFAYGVATLHDDDPQLLAMFQKHANPNVEYGSIEISDLVFETKSILEETIIQRSVFKTMHLLALGATVSQQTFKLAKDCKEIECLCRLSVMMSKLSINKAEIIKKIPTLQTICLRQVAYSSNFDHQLGLLNSAGDEQASLFLFE